MTIITTDEWLANLEELRCAIGESDEGLTAVEMSELVGHSGHWVRKMLRRAQQAGRLKVGKKLMTYLDGRSAMITCYAITPSPPKPKQKVKG